MSGVGDAVPADGSGNAAETQLQVDGGDKMAQH